MESRGPKDQSPPLYKVHITWSGCYAQLGLCGWNTKEPGTTGASLAKALSPRGG